MPQTQPITITELVISAIMAGGLAYAAILHLSNPDIPLPPAAQTELTQLGHDEDHIFYSARRKKAAKLARSSSAAIVILAFIFTFAACSSISVTSELPFITSASQLATSAALTAYPQYAPYVHEVSLAVLSVSGSTPPTPAQLQAAIDSFVKGNTGNALVNVLVQDGEETLEAFIVAEYSSVYAKIGTNGDEALAVLNAIATGMDNASLPALAKLRKANLHR